MPQNRITMGIHDTLLKRKDIRKIECIEGNVWITAKNSPLDIFLRRGETCSSAGLRDVCIQAFEKSVLELN